MSGAARVGGGVFVAGGAQSDFARVIAREGKGVADLASEVGAEALQDAGLDARDVGCVHVANFVGELSTGQGHLGPLVASSIPGLHGLPAARHEGACASGSLAILAATAELEAGRYDVALVFGVEQLRARPSLESVAHLGAAARVPDETAGRKFVWPELFAELAGYTFARTALRREHLATLGRRAFARARANPLAQTRGWTLPAGAFDADDEANPIVSAPLRRHDCSQLTDGAAAVVLVSARARHLLGAGPHARIAGFGHRTDTIDLAPKLARGGPFLLPALREAALDAYRRAGLGPEAMQLAEVHDCFTVSQALAIEALGFAAPAEAAAFIEASDSPGFRGPVVNASGGLVGVGHPVGATGVRMLHDVARQVRGRAGSQQVAGARAGITSNLGGSGATAVSFVVVREES
jgi:acetyl-CoA C-acetyltransferase